MFGTERGAIPLTSVLTVRILDEDTFTFELQSSNFSKKLFKCSTDSLCEEWVSALRSSVKHNVHPEDKKPLKRRMTLSFHTGFLDPTDEDESNESKEHTDSLDVSVLVVSVRSVKAKSETVISRSPSWKRLIRIPSMNRGDELVIMLSNGGTLTISQEVLLMKSDMGADFEAPVQNVLLATSLKIRLQVEEHGISGSGGVSSTSKVSIPLLSPIIDFILRVCESNGRTTTLLILILVVILMSTRSVVSFLHTQGHITISTGILLLFSLSLAIGTARELSMQKKPNGRTSLEHEGGAATGGGTTLCIFLMEHQYISPDAPVKDPEDEIPQRFINAENGDLREARRRWDATRKFREENNVDDILTVEQPHFFTMKELWPHYVCGRGKQGNIIWLERPGDIDVDQLNARGINNEIKLRHWLFITEYQYKYIGAQRLLCFQYIH